MSLRNSEFSATIRKTPGKWGFTENSICVSKRKFDVIYQTRGRVFHQDIQTPKGGLKNEVQPGIFNPLRGVWIPEKKFLKSMLIKTGYPNLLRGSDFLVFSSWIINEFYKQLSHIIWYNVPLKDSSSSFVALLSHEASFSCSPRALLSLQSSELFATKRERRRKLSLRKIFHVC